ncbi:PTS sugar transporter subunit IIA [Lactobacillus melliventris]|uniref:PTS N-acetylglucosamine transporter subunit IIBC n=1 Tax=Lactobacillus melliventris TaxID=1218507 RepID=A0ABX5MY95_9LACO|nr:PTS N-acetylglucosamine transporter subunit IIBC [Lactobacillus melliventris]PXY82469.1 PTS N-acetylglucosamine transporter subunit IIBC [Lactobacillus melliventris]
MKQIVIISHKTLARGMAETVKFFAGNIENIHYLCAYEDGKNEFPIRELTNLINSFNEQDQVFLLTDLLGGSVNQNCSQLIKRKNINVITGVNLALVLSITLDPSNKLKKQKIQELIAQAKNQIVYMNDYESGNESDDE